VKGTAFRIGLIVLILVLVPSLIFSLYEFGTLKRNEEIIKNIYNNQLDAILYSINQYSEDAIGRSTKKISSIYNSENFNTERFFKKQKSNYISGIIWEEPDNRQIFHLLDKGRKHEKAPSINKLIADNKDVINKLLEYIDSDYQKLQPFVWPESEDKTVILFATKKNDQKFLLGLLVDSEEFIRSVLSPAIQTTARERFYINIKDNQGGIIYQSVLNAESVESGYEKELWLLPNYKLQIQLKGNTIESLVRNRTKQNLIIVLILDFTLLLGIFLIIMNVKKEIKLNRMKSEFVSNVSHEIRTPLSLIKMYTETLEMNRIKSDEKRMEYYSIINRETSRLSNIVNKILTFSRLESGQQQYRFSKTNINTLINEVLDSYKFHLEKKDFKLTRKLSENLPDIEADRSALTDAMLNLIDNAIKYSQDKKEIGITTNYKNGFIHCSISDKGVGINKKYQKNIFDKFYRVTDGNRAHKAKGSGLGLSIVKTIVDVHNGKISIESKVGQGTTFTISFPVTK